MRTARARPERTGPVQPGGPPRLVALWVPDWPVVAVRLDSRGHGHVPDPALEPVAVVRSGRVLAASPRARASGVGRGISTRTARSLCPDLTVVADWPERDARAFAQVVSASCAVLADPRVLRPGLATCPVAGPARWWGGEETVAQALVETIAAVTGAECQVGVADSLLAAVLAARDGVLVPAGASPAFLAPRPLRELEQVALSARERTVTTQLVETLERLGVGTLGDLADLGAADVARRFGSAGARAWSLATGLAHDLPGNAPAPADREATTTFDPPLEQAQAAVFAVRQLVTSLSRDLVSRGLAPRRVSLEAERGDGTVLSRTWLLEQDGDDARLADRVRWQLEAWLSAPAPRQSSAPAPLVALRLRALELGRNEQPEEGLWSSPGQEAGARAQRAAEHLSTVLGADGVQVPRLVPGRDPRSRARMVPWQQRTAGADGTGPASWTPAGRQAPVAWTGTLPSPSPARLLAVPLRVGLRTADDREVTVPAQGYLEDDPARLLLPAQPPATLSEAAWWPPPAGRDGGVLQVVSWGGPWAVDEGWWREGGGSRRAYLQVVTDVSPPLLLVRAGQWWLEAVYD